MVLWAIGSGAARTSVGAEAESSPPSGPEFRRIYVPIDQLKDLPRDQVRYVPMKPDEFERVLASARAAGAGVPSITAQVASAEYRAKMTPEGVLQGEAVLRIVCQSDGEVMLPLEPCGLAIAEAEWVGEASRPAELGLGTDGKLEAVVSGSGDLRLKWSLRGTRDSFGSVVFGLELPACPSNTLLLDLPGDLNPSVTTGLVFRESADGAPEGRWRLSLGGHPRVDLSIGTGRGPEDRRPLTLVRQFLVYDLSLRGLDLSAELRLDVHHEPLRQLTVALDPGLELVTAKYGEAAIPWSILSRPTSDRGARILLELPEPIQGIGRVIRLGAVAPVVPEQKWRLPGLRTENTAWQEGNATIAVRPPLKVRQLAPLHGRQSKTAALSPPGSGESMEIQFFSEDAGTELVVARQSPSVQALSGAAIELRGGEVTGQVVTQFQVTEGEVFLLEAEVGRQWLIDSVKPDPPDVLGDGWSLRRETEGSRRLVIQLGKALSPARTVRLIVTGRRLQSPLGRALSVADLIPLRFLHTDSPRQLVALHTTEPYRLKIDNGEGLSRIAAGELNAAERSLFLTPPRGLLFESGAATGNLRLSLETPKPAYSADVRVEAVVAGDALTESYTLRVVPETQVDRLLVHFSQSRPLLPKWTFPGGAENQFAARRLLAAEQAAAGLDDKGESWEITLRHPDISALEIQAARTTDLKSGQPISLVCLPQADTQEGVLLVRSSDAVRIDNARLETAAIPDVPPDQINTTRAVFRYQPGSDAARSDAPAVSISPETTALPRAWAWNCQLESRYQADGTGRHTAVYRMQSHGKRELVLVLPPSADPDKEVSVWTGSRQAAWRRAESPQAGAIVVDLPAGQRFPVVTVQFVSRLQRDALSGTIAPPLPAADVPVLSQNWTVWLPPGYAVVDPSDTALDRSPPLTWTQRLFGPFGRPANRRPVRFGDSEQWHELFSGATESDSAGRRPAQLLQRLSGVEEALRAGAAESESDQHAGTVTWGTLLGKAVERLELTLLVDVRALADLRLAPSRAVDTVPAGPPTLRGAALLQKAGLALLAAPHGLLLTAARDATSYHPYLVPLGGDAVWSVRPGPLAEQLRHAAESRTDPVFVPVELWPGRPVEPSMPWTALPDIGDDPLDTLGWTVHPIEISQDGPNGPLHVVHEDSYQTLVWAVFLAATAVSWWLGKRWPAAVATVLALSGAVALWVPESYSPLASAAVLGVFASLGLLLVRLRPSNPRRAEDTTCGSSTMVGPASIPAGAAVLAVLAVGLVAPAAVAGEPPEKAPSRVVHNVLIPVDEQEKPAGGSYYVPEAFYRELRRRSATASEEPRGWLLRGATYRGTLARQTAGAQLVVTELKAVFDIEVFNPSVPVQIPLSRDGANLLPDGVTLDGLVIQPEWRDAEGTLMVEIGEPGPCRLEVALRPATQSTGIHAGIDLRIPRLATSRLELNLPADAPDVEVLSAKGAVTRQPSPPRLFADLGAADRLALRWPGAAGGESTGPATDVESLLWLQIHPGSVVLNAKFKLKVLQGAVRQLRLTADPRLRLLPLPATGTPVGRVQVIPGQPQEIQLELSPPLEDQAAVEVSFLLTGTSGIGNLRLPHLEVNDVRVTKRWMAVSVDPALVYEQDASSTLEAVALPEFTAAWGKADAPPVLAYRLGPGQPDWTLATRPDEPHVTVDQVLAVSLGPGKAYVRLDAQLATTGYSFQYRLTVPEELEIEKISVRELSIERMARWSRDAPGNVTVFLNGPASENQHLSLEGKLSTPARGTIPLPKIRVQGTEMRSCEVQLFREPSVLVRVAKTVGLEEIEPPIVSQEKAPFGRLLKWFTVVDCSGPVSADLAVSANRPEVTADQVTYLDNASGSWTADVEYRVTVRRGVVDEFRLHLSPQWNGPYQTAAAATLERLDSPDEQELILRPRQAVEGEYRFRISGPLQVPVGQHVAVPDIRLADAKMGQSLIVLPTRAESGPISWETRGLSEVDLPDDLPVPPGARDSRVAYQVENDAFQAVLNPVAGSNRAPTVLLADVRVVWHADGEYQQLTTFDVDPAGTRECLLSLPKDAALVDLRVAGVPSVPDRNSEGEWRFTFPAAAPQRVEVLLEGRLPDRFHDGSRRLQSPKLGALPVARTLWTVSGPKDYLPQTPASADTAEALDLEVLRLQSVLACADLALMDRGEGGPNGGSWSKAWFRYWVLGRDRLKRELAQAAASDRVEATATDLETLERQAAALAPRPGNSPRLSVNAETVATESPQLWLEVASDSATAAYYVSTPGTAAFTLPYVQGSAEPWLQRFLLAAACIALAPLSWIGPLRRLAAQLCCRWPAVLGVVVGLLWWVFLEPGILGWAVVAGTLLMAVFPKWRRPPSRAAVIVVPLSQNQR